MMIFPAFFALVKPVSTIANPACIKNTRAAAMSTHIVLADENTVSTIEIILQFKPHERLIYIEVTATQ
jgi:hypothetical protein